MCRTSGNFFQGRPRGGGVILDKVKSSVSDPYHFDLDSDPRIRIRDDGSGSEVTFDSVNRIFPIKCYARL